MLFFPPIFFFCYCHCLISLHHSLTHARSHPNTHTNTHTHTSQALEEEVSSRDAEVNHLESIKQLLLPLSCAVDCDWLNERVDGVSSGHSDLVAWCERRGILLEQALANAQLFGEDEVEVLNWLAEVAQRLAQVSVHSYQPQLLAKQHQHTLV